MNQQYRELAAKASIFYYRKGKLQEDTEKLIRLIVAECVLAVQNESMNSGDEWEDGLYMAEDAIKQHFGVEE